LEKIEYCLPWNILPIHLLKKGPASNFLIAALSKIYVILDFTITWLDLIDAVKDERNITDMANHSLNQK
jgi:hypothetical protein